MPKLLPNKPKLVTVNTNLNQRNIDFIRRFAEINGGISFSKSLRLIVDFAEQCGIDNIPTYNERIEELVKKFLKSRRRQARRG